jgi:hypothetical protein
MGEKQIFPASIQLFVFPLNYVMYARIGDLFSPCFSGTRYDSFFDFYSGGNSVVKVLVWRKSPSYPSLLKREDDGA